MLTLDIVVIMSFLMTLSCDFVLNTLHEFRLKINVRYYINYSVSIRTEFMDSQNFYYKLYF